jgi:hypothetical protein
MDDGAHSRAASIRHDSSTNQAIESVTTPDRASVGRNHGSVQAESTDQHRSTVCGSRCGPPAGSLPLSPGGDRYGWQRKSAQRTDHHDSRATISGGPQNTSRAIGGGSGAWRRCGGGCTTTTTTTTTTALPTSSGSKSTVVAALATLNGPTQLLLGYSNPPFSRSPTPFLP